MGSNTFSTVNVKVVASAAGVQPSLDKAADQFKSFAGRAGGMFGKAFDSLGGGFSSGAGGIFGSLLGSAKAASGPVGAIATGFETALGAAKKLYDFTRGEGEKDLKLQRQADSVGFSGSGFAGFEVGGGDAALEAFSAALPKMNKLLGEAGDGSDEAAKKLAKFGISAEDAIGKSSEENFRRIADAIAGMGSKAQQTAAGMEVFGKGYQSVARLVERGSKGFDADRIEAIARGNAPDEKLIAATKRDKAADRELEQSWEGLKGNVASAMSPLLDISAAWKKDIAQTLQLLSGYDPAAATAQVRREDAKKAAEAKAAAAAQKVVRANESTDRVGAFGKSLQDQIDSFGMGAREAALYAQKLDLVKSGAINTEKGLKALADATRKSFELNDLDRAKGVKDSIESPYEKTRKEIAEAQRLVGAGKLTPEQFARFAAGKADALGGVADAPGSRLASSLDANSREAASFVLKARADAANEASAKQDPFSRLQDALQRAATAEDAIKDNTGKLLEAFEARGGINVFQF